MHDDFLMSFVRLFVRKNMLVAGGTSDFLLCLPPRSEGPVGDFAG